VVLAHDLTPDQSSAIRAGLADGSLVQLNLEPEEVRVYPQAGGATGTSLAAQLLGFVNRDGTGQYGVEGHWQDLLAGSPQVLLAQRDGTGQPIMESAQTLEPRHARHVAHAHHRRQPPAQAGAGGLRGLGRRQREGACRAS
jgi:cell division protein FtsI/penicillin-binding protein 2